MAFGVDLFHVSLSYVRTVIVGNTRLPRLKRAGKGNPGNSDEEQKAVIAQQQTTIRQQASEIASLKERLQRIEEMLTK
jgi:hypothetical protein